MQIILEVTRRCNMRCPHCMRGDAENINMPNDIVDAALQKASGKWVDTITFTGGEPSLNPAAIRRSAEAINIYDVKVNSFYCVTNGKRVPNEFIEALRQVYISCQDNDTSTVSISNDNMHDTPSQAGVEKLRRFGYDIAADDYQEGFRGFSWKYEGGMKKHSGATVMGMGRAAEWTPNTVSVWKYDINEEYNDVDGMFYVNVYGDVYAICDSSFEWQRQNRENWMCLGNVKDPEFDYVAAAKLFNERYNCVSPDFTIKLHETGVVLE